MKKVLLFTLGWFLFYLHSHAQENVHYPALKKGIYYTFEDVLNATPDTKDSFVIFERKTSEIKIYGGGYFGFDIIGDDLTRNHYRNVYGVSDGEKFYISDVQLSKAPVGASPCELSGPYIIAYFPSLAFKVGAARSGNPKASGSIIKNW